MTVTPPTSQPPTQPPVAVPATAEPEPDQLASEANAALVLLACLLGVVLGTELLVALLGAIA